MAVATAVVHYAQAQVAMAVRDVSKIWPGSSHVSQVSRSRPGSWVSNISIIIIIIINNRRLVTVAQHT